MEIVLKIYFYLLISSGVYFSILIITNVIFFRWANRDSTTDDGPLVSILIPARNEENRIRPGLETIINQSYKNYEVLIIDDNSTDKTWDILKEYEAKSDKIKIFKGKELPEGWLGKPFALHQIGKEAKGDYLIFSDADITYSPNMISWTVNMLRSHKVDAMSGYPNLKGKGFLLYLIFPMMFLPNVSLFPFWLFRKLKTPLMSHAIGQYLCFKRECYQAIGGFEKVKNIIIEDVALAREIKRGGFSLIFVDAKRHLMGHMYEDFEAAVVGLERTIYEYFDKKKSAIFSYSLFLLLFFILPPFIMVWFHIVAHPLAFEVTIGVLLFLFAWTINMYNRRLPWYTPFLYPVHVGGAVFLGWKSMIDCITGKGYVWKERVVI